MGVPLFTNNAAGTLAAGITSSATSISLTAGQGALFPTPGGTDYFMATLANVAGAVEIVKCTARTGDTLTVVRGQESTTAVAWLAADKCELRLTAAVLNTIVRSPNAAVAMALIFGG